ARRALAWAFIRPSLARHIPKRAVALGAAIGLPGEAQVLEMRIGLALRHRTPAARVEQPLRECLDRLGHSEVARDLTHALEPLHAQALDRARARVQIVEGGAVRGEPLRDALDLGDAIEAVEERRQRVGRAADPA